MDKRSILFILALSGGLFFINRWFESKNPKPAPAKAIETVLASPAEASSTPINLPPTAAEDLYVLENDFQQIVFSTIGGCISEINLPFQTEQNKKSLILPIEFDRTMEKDYPFNDHFPVKGFWKLDNGKPQKVAEGQIGGYYPLLRRPIFGENGQVIHSLSPKYFAFNVISDEETLYNKPYQVTKFEKNLIEFSYADNYRKITKTFSLSSDQTPYCLEVSIKVEGDSRGLWLNTGTPDVELISGSFSPTLKYLLQKSQKTQVESLSLPKNLMTYSSISPTWISNSNGFLGLITQPLSDITSGFKANMISGTLAPTRLSIIDAQYDLYSLDKYPGYEFLIPLKTINDQPLKLRFFAGPYQDSLLKKLDATFSQTGIDPHFNSAMSFQGWFTFISEPFAKFLFLLMKFFHQITGSWGFSIILLTLALRIMLYPLNGWSIKSSLRMQQIAPQVTAIQEKYKKDPKKAQMEVLSLYREKGVNPLTGCLPILIQIPFLVGMFDLLKSVFELRGASFIPGWIDNLTAPDVILYWDYPIFFFGTTLHLLPFLLALIMYIQQKMSSQAPKDPKLLTDTQKQQKMMGNVMVIVFTFMFYNFPSGLNIYWLSSMALGIGQQWLTSRTLKTKSLMKGK
ncbi:MAG: membrane protein insertase YidC [Verrucomicrobia bacterium]|nr:membrane protein insertase YidC [Verrucomicrobiota bacterium]